MKLVKLNLVEEENISEVLVDIDKVRIFMRSGTNPEHTLLFFGPNDGMLVAHDVTTFETL